MKRRAAISEIEPESAEESLCRALLSLRTLPAMRAFLRDLCTPAELEAVTDRWKVVPYILKGMPYREIHEHTAVSITTIGRVARFISEGNGGYMKAAKASASRRPAAAGRNGSKKP
jgi:TrpR-related protein YerC/YecD